MENCLLVDLLKSYLSGSFGLIINLGYSGTVGTGGFIFLPGFIIGIDSWNGIVSTIGFGCCIGTGLNSGIREGFGLTISFGLFIERGRLLVIGIIEDTAFVIGFPFGSKATSGFDSLPLNCLKSCGGEIYSNCGNTYEIHAQQYERKNNKLYASKLKLKRLLHYRLDQNVKLLISKLLYSLEINFSKKEDNQDIIQLLNTYSSIINRLFVERNEEELEEVHNLIIDCFISLWEFMATYNLFSDLLNGNYGYTYEILRKYFNPRFDTLLALCKDYLEELNSYLLPREIDQNSKLYKLMGSAKPKVLTKEEKEKLFEDYEDKNLSDRFRKFNLN